MILERKWTVGHHVAVKFLTPQPNLKSKPQSDVSTKAATNGTIPTISPAKEPPTASNIQVLVCFDRAHF